MLNVYTILALIHPLLFPTGSDEASLANRGIYVGDVVKVMDDGFWVEGVVINVMDQENLLIDFGTEELTTLDIPLPMVPPTAEQSNDRGMSHMRRVHVCVCESVHVCLYVHAMPSHDMEHETPLTSLHSLLHTYMLQTFTRMKSWTKWAT